MDSFGAPLSLSNSTVAANSAATASNLDFRQRELRHRHELDPGRPGRRRNELRCRTGQAVTSGGFNIASDASCNLTQTTDLPSRTQPSPRAASEQRRARRSRWRPSPASPAIDKGSFGSEPRDQRGFGRPVDMPRVANAPGGLAVDVGAVEVQTSEVATPTASVTIGADRTYDAADIRLQRRERLRRCSARSITARPRTARAPRPTRTRRPSALADGGWIFRVRAAAITGAEAV